MLEPFALLSDFAKEMNLPLDCEQTSWSFCIDDAHDLMIAKKDLSLTFSCSLNVQAAELNAQTLILLLQDCYLGAKSANAAFAVDPKTSELLLWQKYIGFNDISELKDALNDFIARVLFYKRKIPELIGEQNATDDLPKDSDINSFALGLMA